MIYILSGCFAGALLPDMDTEQSWASQSIPWVDDVLRMISKGSKGKSKKVHNGLKHRGWVTHSIFTVGVSGYLYYKFYNDFTLGITLGIISHLCLDWVTKKGFVSTGTSKEITVYNALWIINCILIWRINI
jgi:membrane-bound metal-dependent hydrolase YbcI (DUF457 family)